MKVENSASYRFEMNERLTEEQLVKIIAELLLKLKSYQNVENWNVQMYLGDRLIDSTSFEVK